MRVLTINSGSSSIKFAIYAAGDDLPPREQVIISGALERIGLPLSRFSVQDASGAVLVEQQRALPDSAAALSVLLEWLKAWLRADAAIRRLDAIGHRIVQGGPQHTQPELITPELLATLRALVPLAPAHLPAELDAVAAVGHAFPDVPQVACFDTAFHRTRPLVGQLYALPWRFTEEGVLRYGFHGLSYEYIVQQLAHEAGPQAGPQAGTQLVVAHLGNGSSMAAIHDGRSMEATMGFTPLGGLVMSTRSGDLDPGVLLYLLEEQHLTPASLRTLLSAESGLLGVSGTSSDMRDLLAHERDDPRAALAVELFCYTARKFLGALAAVLGGLDTLVFTAGIGENADAIRERICAGFGFLGIQLDPTRNAAHAPIISRETSTVTVRVIKTNEELIIARHTAAVVGILRDQDAQR